MRFSLAAAVLAAASVVLAAESPIPGLPDCVFTCTDESAKATGCGNYLNATCLCSSTDFQTAAGTCLAKCTPAEQATAQTFQQTTCSALAGAGNSSASGSSTPTGTGSATGSASPTGSDAAASPTTTDGAASHGAALSGLAVAGAVFALVFSA